MAKTYTDGLYDAYKVAKAELLRWPISNSPERNVAALIATEIYRKLQESTQKEVK